MGRLLEIRPPLTLTIIELLNLGSTTTTTPCDTTILCRKEKPELVAINGVWTTRADVEAAIL